MRGRRINDNKDGKILVGDFSLVEREAYNILAAYLGVRNHYYSYAIFEGDMAIGLRKALVDDHGIYVRECSGRLGQENG